jgi:hypothetical protein
MHERKGYTKDQYGHSAWVTTVPVTSCILFYSILCSNQSILESEGPKAGMNGLKKTGKRLPLPGIES